MDARNSRHYKMSRAARDTISITSSMKAAITWDIATNGVPSKLYRWTEKRFEPFQNFSNMGVARSNISGVDGEAYLCYADILNGSSLYRWDGEIFRPIHRLVAKRARLFTFRTGRRPVTWRASVLFRARRPILFRRDSQLFRWDAGKFALVQEFPPMAALTARSSWQTGSLISPLPNSLTPDIRFRQDSVIYCLSGPEIAHDRYERYRPGDAFRRLFAAYTADGLQHRQTSGDPWCLSGATILSWRPPARK